MFWNVFQRNPMPYEEGFLPEVDGHRIYYREFGNRHGIPVLSFHGGPGGSSRPKYAKLFNKQQYRFIQFDQRGCGQSVAQNAEYNNTTKYILKDAKRLLEHLKIQQPIIVHGMSWGSTLALLFAEKYPEIVQKIIVSSVFLAREYDIGWVNKESERFYPDLWAEMRQQINGKDVYKTYHKMLKTDDTEAQHNALKYFGSYEYMLGQLAPAFAEPEEITENIIQSKRIAFRFDENKYFIKNNLIIQYAAAIQHIPTLIVHNRFDFCCPVKQAWDLHQALPQSDLTIVPDYGHSTPQLFKVVKKRIVEFLAKEDIK